MKWSEVHVPEPPDNASHEQVMDFAALCGTYIGSAIGGGPLTRRVARMYCSRWELELEMPATEGDKPVSKGQLAHCRVCRTKTRWEPKQALQNTLACGTPDFPGSSDMDGQTFSYTGPAELIDIMACSKCGRAVNKLPATKGET